MNTEATGKLDGKSDAQSDGAKRKSDGKLEGAPNDKVLVASHDDGDGTGCDNAVLTTLTTVIGAPNELNTEATGKLDGKLDGQSYGANGEQLENQKIVFLFLQTLMQRFIILHRVLTWKMVML